MGFHWIVIPKDKKKLQARADVCSALLKPLGST